MVQRLFRTWTVTLVCSALVAILAYHVSAQTTYIGIRHQAATGEQILMSKCPTTVSRSWKSLAQTMRNLKALSDWTNFEPITSQAQARLADRETHIFWPHGLGLMLTEETSGSIEAGQKIMRGAKVIPSGMLVLMMKDDKTLSGAERTTREGHGMLERGQKILMTPRL